MNPSPDLEQPFEVDQVIVSGLERTRESLVQAVLHPARNASSVSDIVQRLAEAEQKLAELDIFEDDGIDFTLDRSQGNSGALNILANFTERRKTMSMSVESGTDENHKISAPTGSYTVTNTFGNAEKVSLEIGTDPRTMSYTTSLKLFQPRLYDTDTVKGQIHIFPVQLQARPRCGYQEISSGAVCSVAGHLDSAKTLEQTVTLEHVIRQNTVLPTTSHLLPVFRSLNLGTHSKSSVKHKMLFDNRLDGLTSRDGCAAFVENEFGVGANTAFLKHEAAAQYNVSFNPFQQSAAFGSLFSLGMSASVGHLHSISGTGSDGTCINDRFFSGGANSLRGFEADGVGPHVSASSSSGECETYAKGGDTFLHGSLTLGTPLPQPFQRIAQGLITSDLINFQCFANAGCNWQAALESPTKSVISQTLDKFQGRQFAGAAGFGLAWLTRFGRIELSYTPLWFGNTTDCKRRRLQLGISVGYL